MLNVMHDLPKSMLSLPANKLYKVLDGPTLFHFEGERGAPVFVSALLHGNEPAGWEALRRLLLRYEGTDLPRSLSFYIGNVEAARYGKRYLDHQPDYNRVWRGDGLPEHDMMRQIQSDMKKRNVFLSIDVHNTTGKNPHYACVNRTKPVFLNIARIFSNRVVYFLRPEGVQTVAFARLCPAVTIECGQPGQESGIEHAVEFIDRCLNLDELPDHIYHPEPTDLFHTVAVVKVPEQIRFDFDGTGEDIQFERSFESYNFCGLPVGMVIGRIREGLEKPLDIRDDMGNEVSRQYFSFDDGMIRSRQEVFPAMITTNVEIIRKDCLCYLMERYPLSKQK